jgi:hypothetical protein
VGLERDDPDVVELQHREADSEIEAREYLGVCSERGRWWSWGQRRDCRES